MKNKIFLSSFLYLLFLMAQADAGDPTIQTVCKVTLKNGMTVEGFIKLGTGGYTGIWPNGFYFEMKVNKYVYHIPLFFDLNFTYLEMKDSVYSWSHTTNIPNCTKIRFIEWIGPYNTDPRIVEYSKGKRGKDTLKVITHLEKQYIAYDSLKIFTNLSSSTHLPFQNDNPEKLKFTKIAVKDIVRLEFIQKPAQPWLDLIKKAEAKAQELYNGEDSSGDFVEALWYHEIIAGNNKEYYQEIIDFNIKR